MDEQVTRIGCVWNVHVMQRMYNMPNKLKVFLCFVLITAVFILAGNNYLSVCLFPSKHHISRYITSYDICKANPDLLLQGPNTPRPNTANQTQSRREHIGFLKVHKAGSSTMQNIFFRFAVKYNLNVLLPAGDTNYIFSAASSMPIGQDQHYDIFAIHTVYEYCWFKSILPEDSVNIGIVRSPLERFISAAYYYRDVFHTDYLQKVPNNSFILDLVLHPEKYEMKNFSYTKNSMGKDFGFSESLSINDVDDISRHLKLLTKDFELVLIMERFEESLVLMRRMLNWSILDIVYLRVNTYVHPTIHLKPEELATFRTTCFLDFAIYEHFLEIFKKKVENEGPTFVEEVSYFNEMVTNVTKFCSDNQIEHLLIRPSKWNDEVGHLTKPECNIMKAVESNFIEKLKQRHKQSHKIKKCI